MLDLNDEELEQVRSLLAEHVPGRSVWAFGSRVSGRLKKYSDLDLAVIGDAPLPFSVLGPMAEAFSESDLPFRVDIVDWAKTSEEFRERIRRQHELIV